MKKSELKNKIREVITEIASEDELKKEINAYKKNSSEVEKLEKSIADTLKKIKDLSKAEETRLKQIINYMQDFKVKKVQADKWVASLEQVSRYSRPQPSYKELWEEALKKLNAKTVDVMKQMEHAQVAEKSKETKPEFKIDSLKEGLIDAAKKGLKSLVSYIKGLLKSMQGYKSVVDSLPPIKSEVNEVENKKGSVKFEVGRTYKNIEDDAEMIYIGKRNGEHVFEYVAELDGKNFRMSFSDDEAKEEFMKKSEVKENISQGDKEIEDLKKEAGKYSKNDVRYKEIMKKLYDLETDKDYGLPGSQAGNKFGKPINEKTSQLKFTRFHQDQISKLTPEQKKKLKSDLDDAVSKVNDMSFDHLGKDKAKTAYSKAMKDEKEKVFKKYIKLTEELNGSDSNTPKVSKSKDHPNFIYVRLFYPTGGRGEYMSIGGKETGGGQMRREGAEKAMNLAKGIAKNLENNYELEDISVEDLRNGAVEVFAVSDEFIPLSAQEIQI